MYTLFQIKKKVNLEELIGERLNIQDVLRFSEGTQNTKEDLHYEDSEDSEIKAYEIFIPIGTPITIRISPVQAPDGTPKFSHFNKVTVQEDQGIIIHPKVCHFVEKADRFMVLKVRDGWKFSRNAATPQGECKYQDQCGSRDICPHPRQPSPRQGTYQP